MNTVFDIEDIKAIIPHRYPFILVDKIVLMETAKIQGIKNVTINEPFFSGHFPKQAIMPGVLQIEAMAQVAAFFAIKTGNIKNPSVYFLTIDKAKFRKMVVPGDQLLIEIIIKKFSLTRMSFRGLIYVDGKVVSEAEMMAMVKKND